jgi:hypothetical protein
MNQKWHKTNRKTNNMFKVFRENFGWIKDMSVVVFLIGILYLQSHFVTTEKFELYQKANDLAHQAIQITLVSVDKTLALMQQNNSVLVENEKALKMLTSKVSELDTKTRYYDSLEFDKFMQQSAVHRAELDTRLKSLEKKM